MKSSDLIGQQDYDGDACPIELLLDERMYRLSYPLAQRFNLLGMAAPYKTSGFNSIPKPLVAQAALWMDS